MVEQIVTREQASGSRVCHCSVPMANSHAIVESAHVLQIDPRLEENDLCSVIPYHCPDFNESRGTLGLRMIA
jgi:hypothetical protein